MFNIVIKFNDGEEFRKEMSWDEICDLLADRTPTYLVESVSVTPVPQHIKKD